MPLHEQETERISEPEQLPIENKEPVKLFNDLGPGMRENDLDVPAFIRRQQD